MERLLTCCCLISFAFSPHALPTLTNRCGEKLIDLTLPSNTDVIAYDKECTTAFVGPPSKGTAKILSATSSGNLSFCPSVKSLPNVVNKLMKATDYWTTKLIEATNEALALEKTLDEKRAILIDFQEEQRRLEKQLAAWEEKLVNLTKEIKDARSRLSDCQVMNGNNELCIDQEKELLDLKKNYLEFRDRHVAPIQEEIFEVEQKTRNLDRKLKQIGLNIAENNEIFEGLKRRLKILRNDAIEEYSIFGSLEGITAHIAFESKWGEQIEWAKRNNPHRELHIEALPITKSRIHVDTAIVSSNRINMPSTLMYASIPGFVNSGIIKDALPSGDKSIDTLDADLHQMSP